MRSGAEFQESGAIPRLTELDLIDLEFGRLQIAIYGRESPAESWQVARAVSLLNSRENLQREVLAGKRPPGCMCTLVPHGRFSQAVRPL